VQTCELKLVFGTPAWSPLAKIDNDETCGRITCVEPRQYNRKDTLTLP